MAAGHPNVNGCMSLLPIPALSDHGVPPQGWVLGRLLLRRSVFESPRAYHGIKRGIRGTRRIPQSLALVQDACGRPRTNSRPSQPDISEPGTERVSWPRLALVPPGGADEVGSRREAARTCSRGRSASRMSWKSPNVVSNFCAFEEICTSSEEARLPRSRTYRTTNRMTTTASEISAASTASRIRRRHNSSS